ncbi:hypothetical protein LINPERPRIM_LOCUS28964, partial [Linum perenne]
VQVVDKIEFPVYAPRGSLDIRHNLIESCGELLLFRKCFFGYCSYMDVLVHMVVFRVDMDAMRLEEVDDLGDRAFFYSWSNGFGCCASQSGFERNSIYFINYSGKYLYRYDYGDKTVSFSMLSPQTQTEKCDGCFMVPGIGFTFD